MYKWLSWVSGSRWTGAGLKAEQAFHHAKMQGVVEKMHHDRAADRIARFPDWLPVSFSAKVRMRWWFWQ
jgi:hypothetical protein